MAIVQDRRRRRNSVAWAGNKTALGQYDEGFEPQPNTRTKENASARIPGVCLHACVYACAYVRAYLREQNASVVLDYWCVQICIAGLGHMLKRKQARVC